MKQMRFFLGVVLIWGALASDASAYVLNQLKLDKKFAVLKSDAGETPTDGSVLQLEKNGQLCRLKVYSVKGPWVAATPESCDHFSELTPGDQFLAASPETPAPPEEPASPETPAVEPTTEPGTQSEPPISEKKSRIKSPATDPDEVKRHHVGALLYYALAKNPEYKYTPTTTLNGNSTVGTTEEGQYLTGGAPGFGIRYQYLPMSEDPVFTQEFHWGFNAGFNYDLTRKVTGLAIASGTARTITDLKFQVSNFELNALGSLQGFTVFGGPNLSMIKVSGNDRDDNLNYLGALGLQAGAGYLLPHLGIELLYRSLNGKVGSSVVEVENESEKLRLWGVMIRATGFISF